MKLKVHGMFLSLFFVWGLVFSFAVEASAHMGDHSNSNGKTARGISDPTERGEVEAFLAHIEETYHQTEGGIAELAQLLRNFRKQEEYIDLERNIYSFSINSRDVVTNHAKYPELFGYAFNKDSDTGAVIEKFLSQPDIERLPDESVTPGMRICMEYGEEKPEYGNRKRVACAVNLRTPNGSETIVVGFHHEKGEIFTPPDCSGFDLGTPAKDVYANPSNDGKLEAYVKGVIRVLQQQMRDAVHERIEEIGGEEMIPRDPRSLRFSLWGQSVIKLNDKLACYGDEKISEDLKHENIYVFIMSADPQNPLVLFNGNNTDLNGTNLEARDHLSPGEPKVSELFSEELGMPEAGKYAYINYHWDDPKTRDDDIEDFLQTGTVPGTSCKRSYIEVADMNSLVRDVVPFEYLLIFGSGTYPGDDVCDDNTDDGCSIAGAGYTYKGALLNLFLVTSVLLSVVFLRRSA